METLQPAENMGSCCHRPCKASIMIRKLPGKLHTSSKRKDLLDSSYQADARGFMRSLVSPALADRLRCRRKAVSRFFFTTSNHVFYLSAGLPQDCATQRAFIGILRAFLRHFKQQPFSVRSRAA